MARQDRSSSSVSNNPLLGRGKHRRTNQSADLPSPSHPGQDSCNPISCPGGGHAAMTIKSQTSDGCLRRSAKPVLTRTSCLRTSAGDTDWEPMPRRNGCSNHCPTGAWWNGMEEATFLFRTCFSGTDCVCRAPAEWVVSLFCGRRRRCAWKCCATVDESLGRRGRLQRLPVSELHDESFSVRRRPQLQALSTIGLRDDDSPIKLRWTCWPNSHRSAPASHHVPIG